MTIAGLYRPSLALLTDLYQLTMAYGYWKLGIAEQEAVFHLTFRKNPFKGGFAIACGLETVVEYVEGARFEAEDVEYLRSLTGNDGAPLFEADFIDYLANLELSCDIDAVPEGTPVFPHEPLIRMKGPLLQCQILETPLLNIVNFATLIATKASRITLAAKGEPVLEFGLRRAQGIDGSLTASRAAYVGGCAATSNVLAGRLYNIPVKGTHAHAWIMAFEDEISAFEAYAQAMPNNCVFLVDTYDTLDGVRNAIAVGRKLREQGYQLAGIRLDSGDLAWLSIEARKILDEAGFADTAIVASNDLDEHVIGSLKAQGAKITVWGVGTKLTTAYDQPALGGVYKLAAIKNDAGEWRHTVKLSEQAIKVSNPGIQQVRRYLDDEGNYDADMIYDELNGEIGSATMIDPMDMTRRKHFSAEIAYQELLVPIFEGGKRVYEPPSLDEIRAHRIRELERFHSGIKRFDNPHAYPVGLERSLHETKTKLILNARGES